MHPLSLFPQLFFLSPLSATLLRIVSGLVFLYLAYFYYHKREHLAQVDVPIVGRGMWKPLLATAWCALVGVGLFFGFYTQLAAICGAIVGAKFIGWKKFCPEYVPVTYITSALLTIICISILLTGAGAFAFDWPL